VQDVSAEAKSITRQKEHAIAWARRRMAINPEPARLRRRRSVRGRVLPEKRPGLARFLRDIGATDEHDVSKFGRVSKRRPPFQAVVLMAEDRVGRDVFNMPFVMNQITDRSIRVLRLRHGPGDPARTRSSARQP